MQIPEFGSAITGMEYILRPGGYAVIINERQVAVVVTPTGLALPGGGQEHAESPQDAAIRETREECGLEISVGPPMCVADELIFAKEDQTHYRKRCVFFFAKVVGKSEHPAPEHELLWLSPERAVAELRDASQQWAVSVACHPRSLR